MGHIHDAACLAGDLPALPNGEALPDELTIHPGVHLGSEAPTAYRARVAALPTITAELLKEDAPHAAAFAGDDAHDFYYGMIPIIFSCTPHLDTRLSPRLATRLSPRLATRLSPRLATHLSPRLATHLLPHLSPHASRHVTPHASRHASPHASRHTSRHAPLATSRHTPLATPHRHVWRPAI